jgi:hypothetical protein
VLKDRWPLVVALADGLATSPRTTGEEVEALIGHAGASLLTLHDVAGSLPITRQSHG